MHHSPRFRRVSGRSGRPSAAFTLVELMVVLAIIGTLAAMLLPAVQRARETARQVSCRNNLRNIGIAILNHESAKRLFPVGCDNLSGNMHAWSSFILPYLEEGATAARIDYSKPWDDVAGNRTAADTTLQVYICPSSIVRYRGKQDYFGIAGIGLGAEGVPAPGYDPGPTATLVPDTEWTVCGMLYSTDSLAPVGVQAASVTDGLSHTLMVSESTDAADASELSGPDADVYLLTVAARWAKRSSQVLNKRVVNDNRGEAFFSNHFGSLSALFADGRVRAIDDGISPAALVAVSTRNGGEIQSEY
jgi:prepilin-type N-terminal cleavage/methylation domain-containing protein